jgi:hypothetical protein
MTQLENKTHTLQKQRALNHKNATKKKKKKTIKFRNNTVA